MAKRQKSGLYRSKVTIGTDVNGLPMYKYISAHTKAALEDEKKRVTEHYLTGVSEEKDPSFEECARLWFELEKVPHISPSSVEAYRTALNKHILPAFGQRKMKAIRAAELQAFINGFAGSSLTKLRMLSATIKGVFKYACVNQYLINNPATYISLPKSTPAKEKKALTLEERKSLEKCCVTEEHGYFLALLYYLGLRQGEARGLRWGDFDWNKSLVHIQRDIDNHDGGVVGAVKTPSSNRYVPLPTALKEILLPRKGRQNEYVCKGEINPLDPWGKTVTERIWCELCVKAGLANPLKKGDNRYRSDDIRSKYKPTITPHVLRHNYITMCWENGIDCYVTMKLVGHANYKTTMDIYTHLTNQQMGKTVNEVEKMFKK